MCEWDVAKFLIFSGNGEPLIYYSHLTSIAIFLGLLGFTFLKLRQWPRGAFRLMAVSYIVWLFCDLVLWANDNIEHVLFFWTVLALVEPLIFVSAYAYFIHFVDGKPLGRKMRWVIFALLLPTMIMAPIGLSVVGFDFTDCDRNVVEGISVYYTYFLEAVFIALILIKTGMVLAKKTYIGRRVRLSLVSLGTSILLFSFLIANFLGTFTGDYVTSQYGHIAVPVFAAFLAYLTIKYESFEPRILLIDTLVVALFILLLSVLFATDDNYQIYANIMAFLIMIPLGYSLTTGIRKEVKARKEIEVLAHNLETSNKQQIILIHFITHQIKGFVTKSRNIFSVILDGDTGLVPETMKPMLQEGLKSDTKGVATIQEILNAANIKSGKVEYKKESFDLKALVEEVIHDLRAAAEAKGLTLAVSTGTEPIMYPGDKGQLVNALKNLIDNSIKYTPKGEIRIALAQEGTLIRFSVADDGIGITPEDMAHLFTEGGHGANSTKINVESTGFGLYIVKNIIEAHNGKVWAESEGEGKGSKFIVELPV